MLTAAATEAAAATGGAAIAAAVALTSPELVKLQADKKTAWAKQRAIEDMDSKEYTEAALEVVKINAAIKAEQARLSKEQSDAKLAELRNAAVAEFDNMLSLRDAAKAKGATPEAIDAAKNAYEAIVNKLLPKVATVKVAGATGGASAGGSKYEGINQSMLAGETYDQMIAKGYGDGTIRTVASKEGFKKNTDGTYTKK